ncbi:MAG: sulfatase-like hydrolase/transferase [Verrucomicrobiota bacterium]
MTFGVWNFANAASRPNIIYILADDLGYGDLGCYNKDSKIPTPHLDQLADEGMRFTDAHSPTSVCTPTRYALFTGRYSWRTRLQRGVIGAWGAPLIAAERLTAPELLRQHGYATGMVGKWHLGPLREATGSPVTEWSVESKQYGEFLIQVFEDWVVRDVGEVYVQLFDVALANWMGLGSAMCVFAERCGAALALEHNGDVFSCDHYVYPNFKLGNLMNQSLGDMVNSPAQRKFGNDKADTLPKYCRECEVRFACHGECPKHRFITTPDGEPGLNYLCAGYKRFFNHIEPYMQAMAQILRSGRPASGIMQLIAQHEQSDVWRTTGRNDPCPCGSGRKYKHCCLPRRTTASP